MVEDTPLDHTIPPLKLDAPPGAQLPPSPPDRLSPDTERDQLLSDVKLRELDSQLSAHGNKPELIKLRSAEDTDASSHATEAPVELVDMVAELESEELHQLRPELLPDTPDGSTHQ
jgi:hypothetical protein